jgi:hypothetical protein
LDRLASELADQRHQLAEQWQRLADTQQRWGQDQAHAVAEFEALVGPLQEQEQALAQREQACSATEEDLRRKHRELVQMRQHLVGWRARLRAREASWEGERKQLLVAIQHRERHAEEHDKAFAELRQRWSERRRQEADRLQAEQAACDTLGREYLQLRQEWLRRYTAVEEDKRVLVEKELALEQLSQQMLARHGDVPAAQRSVGRLRRRWLAQNAGALRTLGEERKSLKTELVLLETRHTELGRLAQDVSAAEARLAEKRAHWEQLQTESDARFARMQHDLDLTRSQRECAEEQLEKLKEEVEQIARTLLLEEREPPALPAEKAA